jgi:hypothetical protein
VERQAYAGGFTGFPDSVEGDIFHAGLVKARIAMTFKTATFKFVIWTTIAVALGIITWSSAAKRSPSIDQARAKQAVATSPEIAELPNLQLSRVRLLVSNLN